MTEDSMAEITRWHELAEDVLRVKDEVIWVDVTDPHDTVRVTKGSEQVAPHVGHYRASLQIERLTWAKPTLARCQWCNESRHACLLPEVHASLMTMTENPRGVSQ